MGPLAVVDPEPGVGEGTPLRDRFKEVRVQHLGSVASVNRLLKNSMEGIDRLIPVYYDARAPSHNGALDAR